jgi:probable rRNA maturation factor
MVEHEISVKIDPALKTAPKTSALKKVVKQILETVNIDGIVELSVVFTDNDTIQNLNRQYRNIDSPTDVLAFQMYPGDRADETDFIMPPDSIRHLGEVIISYPQAAIQAKEYRHSTRHEIKILLIHGILHLLGYDHEIPDEEAAMRMKEEEILRKLTEPGD